MVLVVRDSQTEILENVEHLTGIVPGFQPNFKQAHKVVGYLWDWEVPVDNVIWQYGMTSRELKKLKANHES